MITRPCNVERDQTRSEEQPCKFIGAKSINSRINLNCRKNNRFEGRKHVCVRENRKFSYACLIEGIDDCFAQYLIGVRERDKSLTNEKYKRVVKLRVSDKRQVIIACRIA